MNAAPCIGALPALTELSTLYFDRMSRRGQVILRKE